MYKNLPWRIRARYRLRRASLAVSHHARRVAGRVLCHLNQHAITVESIEWVKPDPAFIAAHFGGGDLERVTREGRGDGILQVRCRRGCWVIYPWSFIERHGDPRRERLDLVAAGRALARASLPGVKW